MRRGLNGRRVSAKQIGGTRGARPTLRLTLAPGTCEHAPYNLRFKALSYPTRRPVSKNAAFGMRLNGWRRAEENGGTRGARAILLVDLSLNVRRFRRTVNGPDKF